MGFFPFHRGIMWPRLVKIKYTELKLSCGNDHVVKNSIYSNGDLDIWPNDPTIKMGFLPFHRGIMWPSVLKIQYIELKWSCGNDPVVNNSIYSNSGLDLWPNDTKINRVLSLTKGNHVAKLTIRYTELKLLCGNLCGRPPARNTRSHNTAPSRDGRIKSIW
jgi:hypothetical protein